jgi:hypothetical protein
MLKTLSFCLFLSIVFVAYKYEIGPKYFTHASLKNEHIVGPVDLEKSTAEALSITGPFTAKDTTFTTLSCIGPVKLEQVICETIDVVGPTELKNCKIKGDTSIIGTLDANNSEFEKITITTSHMHLENSKTQNIVIKKNSNANEKQKLVLSGSTIIDGNIVFESGQGIIEKSSTVKINGSITGCSVVNK